MSTDSLDFLVEIKTIGLSSQNPKEKINVSIIRCGYTCIQSQRDHAQRATNVSMHKGSVQNVTHSLTNSWIGKCFCTNTNSNQTDDVTLLLIFGTQHAYLFIYLFRLFFIHCACFHLLHNFQFSQSQNSKNILRF